VCVLHSDVLRPLLQILDRARDERSSSLFVESIRGMKKSFTTSTPEPAKMISNDPSEASTIDYVVTTDMSCQVTEDEIRRTTGFQGFPEFGGEPGSDHPLRILSEENLTVVSSFGHANIRLGCKSKDRRQT